MFLGEYQHNLDTKGEGCNSFQIPAAIEREGNYYQGLDRCLFVFTEKEWEIFIEKIVDKMPIARSDSRAFTRLMLAEATDAEVDKQGRVLIPNYLREYAHLKKKLLLPDFITGLKSGIQKAGKNINQRRRRTETI